MPRYFLHLDSNGPHNWNIFAKNVTTQRAESALISSSLFSQDNASGMYVYAKKIYINGSIDYILWPMERADSMKMWALHLPAMKTKKKEAKKKPVTISPHIGPTKSGGQLRQSRCQIKMSSLWTTRRSPLICQQRWIELFPVSAPKPTDQPLFRSMAVACPCSGLTCRLTYWPTDELADGRTQRNAPAGGRTEVLLAGRLS